MFYLFLLIFSSNLFSDETIPLYIMSDLKRFGQHIYSIPFGQKVDQDTRFNLEEICPIDVSYLTYDQKIDILQQLRPDGIIIPDKTDTVKTDSFVSNNIVSWKNYIYNQRHTIMFAFGTCAYCYIFFKLLKSCNVNCSFHWSYWKDEIPLEVLSELPREKVLQELTTEINEFYSANQESITNPLFVFIKDVKYEIAIIQRFTNYYEFLKKIWLASLFPNYENPYLFALEKIDRLLYLQELIQDSISEKYSL